MCVQVHETVTKRKRLFSHRSDSKSEHFTRFTTECGFEFFTFLGGAGVACCRGRKGALHACAHVHT